MYQILDYKTRKPVKPKGFVYTGENGPWDVVMDLELVKKQINEAYFRRTPPYNSKYLPLMPIKNHARFVSLSEGGTPLIPSRKIGKKLGIKLYFKLEAQNPTGAFKDRGSAVEMTVVSELGAPAVIVASTGNMAASVACYAAAAGIPCFIVVPEGTPPTKLAQAISYGGKIVQVKGSYNDAVYVAQTVAEKLGFYLAGDYAFRVEGQKTAAYEVIDQLYYRVPDYVIVPMGCGTNIASYGKGFREYRELGFIDSLPHLIGVQAAGSSSIVNAYDGGDTHVTALTSTNTIASAIAVNYPLDGEKALSEIRGSEGGAYALTDREILEAEYMLSTQEGIFVEASSAASLAGLIKLVEEHNLKGKTVVCVLTGNGLKDPTSILKIATKPPTIYPSTAEFLSLYENSFFEGKNISFVDRETVLFDVSPTDDAIRKHAFKHFQVKLSSAYVEKIKDKIAKFLQKGKHVTFSDFQDILQDILESPTDLKKKKSFEVVDFSVKTSKDTKPQATVEVRFNGTTEKGKAEGTGPVDAVINALRSVGGRKIEFKLTDYNVDIRSSGSDAVVHVELKLERGGKISVGQGASPDIIQASIEAFENAYNSFLA